MTTEVCYMTMVMPKELNHHGTLFGGEVCSIIDKACAIFLKRRTEQKFVTRQFNELAFVNPILPGDILTVYCSLIHIGNTSVTVSAEAIAERMGTKTHVTDSTLTFVTLDENGMKTKATLSDCHDH